LYSGGSGFEYFDQKTGYSEIFLRLRKPGQMLGAVP